jgi:hypothetical protein
MAVVSIASAVASQQQAAHSARVQTENAKNAQESDMQLLDLQAKQIGDKATQEATDIRRAAIRERGALLAAQSEAGFMGNSPFRELYNARLKEAEAVAAVGTNQSNALMQNMAQRTAAHATAQGRINDAWSRVPNSFVAGLQIATAGMQGAYTGYTYGKAYKGEPVRGTG